MPDPGEREDIVNPQKSLSQDIWDGNYGGFGQDGVLARAKRAYEKYWSCSNTAGIVAYTSALYSVMGGCFARGVLYYPLGLLAFARLYRLAIHPLPLVDWTANQCETMSAILLSLSNFWFLPAIRRYTFEKRAEALVELGIQLAEKNKETSPHTRAFLYLHRGVLMLAEEEGLRRPVPGFPAPWRVEGLAEFGAGSLEMAADYAEKVTDPDQRSRCYRGLAEAYHRYRLGHDFTGEKAKKFMCKADAVSPISRSVAEKNTAARKRMRLW